MMKYKILISEFELTNLDSDSDFDFDLDSDLDLDLPVLISLKHFLIKNSSNL